MRSNHEVIRESRDEIPMDPPVHPSGSRLGTEHRLPIDDRAACSPGFDGEHQ